jgi:hypothetical protein
MLDNSVFSEPSDGPPGTLDRKIALKNQSLTPLFEIFVIYTVIRYFYQLFSQIAPKIVIDVSADAPRHFRICSSKAKSDS